MDSSVFLNFSGFLYTLLITICFFGKKRINSNETKIYGLLLVQSLMELIIGLLSAISIINNFNIFIIELLGRFFIISMLIWIVILTLYIVSISNKLNTLSKKRIYGSISLLTCLSMLLIFILPLNYYNDNGVVYSEGAATFVLVACSLILLVVMIASAFRNMKKFDKRYIPLWIFIFAGVIILFIQVLYPELFLVVPLEVFITSVMYHTIENPDVKMIEELEIARDQAEKANMAKSDFLSSMSHEIRTPLNAIVGLSRGLNDYDGLSSEMKEDINDIINASETLLEIVGNILDINKIESDKLEITEMPYNFKEEITDMVKVTITRINDKPIKFNLNMSPDIPYELLGDKVHIKEIVNNLLTNAIKYTDEGYINLNIKCINQNNICNLIISVEDSGRGIKAENITKLFTKFERLGIEKTTTTEGTGLGLAITKKLIEMMGGKINVQSTYGQGSLFVVQISQKISIMTEPLHKIETNQEVSPMSYNDKKVLIVDDNALNIKVAKRVLKDFNLQIEEALTGEECLEKVRSNNNYDLILMDIMMPEMNGEETFQKLKEITSFQTPVVALTADAIQGAREKYLEVGFTDYLSKPFTKEQIKQLLDQLFSTNKKYNPETDRFKNVEPIIID